MRRFVRLAVAAQFIAGALLVIYGVLGLLGGAAVAILFVVVGLALIVRARRQHAGP
jgi:hypothetical protein